MRRLVGPMSLRHRARALSALNVRTILRPSLERCCEKHPCFSSCRRDMRPTILRLNDGVYCHPPEFFVDAETYADAFQDGEASRQISMGSGRTTLRGSQTQRTWGRRRGGWGISHRRLGSDRDVGPAAATGMYGVRSARQRGQGPCAAPGRDTPPTSTTRATNVTSVTNASTRARRFSPRRTPSSRQPAKSHRYRPASWPARQ